MKWAYPPDALTKKNQGFVCYFFQRVYQERFKGKYNSIEMFVQSCCNDLQLFQVFNHWLNMAVEIMKQNGVHDVKIRWGDEGFSYIANIDFQIGEVTLRIRRSRVSSGMFDLSADWQSGEFALISVFSLTPPNPSPTPPRR